MVEHLAKLVDYDPALLATASQLVGIVAAGLTGQDAQIAANLGLHATEYNRRLHLSERQLAQELAARSDGRWSVEQIEDALRWSDNAETAESYFDGVVVRLDQHATPYEVRDNAYDIVSNGFVIQQLNQIPLPDSELMAFIQQHTGETYSWRPGVFPGEPADPHAGMAWTSSGYVPIRSADATDSLSYQWFYADGQAFRLPVTHCPSVACTNSAPIAWGSTQPGDQAVLAAFEAAVGRQTREDLAMLATVATAASPIGLSRLTVSGLVSTRGAVAFGVGAGFQSAGDYYKTDEVDLYRSALTGTTAWIAAPLFGASLANNSLLGGMLLGGNAMAHNAVFGANESVADNYRLGLIASGAGTAAGHGTTILAQQIFPRWVRATPYNPYLPAVLQAPAQFSPVSGAMGTTVDTFVSNSPAFFDTSRQGGREP